MDQSTPEPENGSSTPHGSALRTQLVRAFHVVPVLLIIYLIANAYSLSDQNTRLIIELDRQVTRADQAELIITSQSDGISKLLKEKSSLQSEVKELDTELTKTRSSLQPYIDENRRFRDENRDLQNSVDTLTRREELFQILQRSYIDVFESSIKPPVSKARAVEIAFSSKDLKNDQIEGKILRVQLIYCSFFGTQNGRGFQLIKAVTEPIDDYSAEIIYNAPSPSGGEPPEIGTLTYRYCWAITLDEPIPLGETGYALGIPPDYSWYVDASSGEIINVGVTPI